MTHPTDSPRPTRFLVVSFTLVSLLAVACEVVQHAPHGLARVLQGVGMDPTDPWVGFFVDRVRFQGSDLFGAAGYILWAWVAKPDPSLSSRASDVLIALTALEVMQMLARRAPLDVADLVAYGLGALFAAAVVQASQALPGVAFRPPSNGRGRGG